MDFNSLTQIDQEQIVTCISYHNKIRKYLIFKSIEKITSAYEKYKPFLFMKKKSFEKWCECNCGMYGEFIVRNWVEYRYYDNYTPFIEKINKCIKCSKNNSTYLTDESVEKLHNIKYIIENIDTVCPPKKVSEYKEKYSNLYDKLEKYYKTL